MHSLSRAARDQVLALLQDRDPYRRKVVELVSDKLRTELARTPFPHSCAVLASSLEPAVMRALSDVWVELSGREICSPDRGSDSAIEACLRVSTAQRGGVWVTGRRLSQERFLYMVIDRCPTLNDMYEIFEDTCDGLQARSFML